DAIVRRHRARRAAGATHVAAGRAPRPRQPRAQRVQLGRALPDAVLVELEPARAERVGLDEVRARLEIPAVDPPHHVGVCVVPELRTGAVGETSREQRRAVAAVEDQELATPGPFDDLPAARAPSRQVLTGTPSSCLARTTASVESLAYPSASISS